MISLLVFLFAAAIVSLAPRLPWPAGGTGVPRLAGVAFVAAVLLAAAGGLLLAAGRLPAGAAAPPAVALALLGITALLYVAAGLRGVWQLPTVLADLLVVVAAGAAIACGQPAVHTLRVPFSNAALPLGALAMPLTVLWVWLLARLTAALNRTPQVTGGYLGIVGLTFVLLLKIGPRSGLTFAAGSFGLGGHPTGDPRLAIFASAALAGAGLASVPLALRRPNTNVGWSASLALGFLLAQITLCGLLQNAALAVAALLLLVLGLPLLDVAFYRLRRPRGITPAATDAGSAPGAARLHEALAFRGLSAAKIGALYLAMAVALCGLALLLAATARWNLALRLCLLALVLAAGFVFFFSVVRVLMRRAPGEEVPAELMTFGMKVTPVSMTEAIERIDAMIATGKPHHVVTCDANAILRAQEDPEYADIVRRAAMITPDGYGVMWGARLLNLPIYERVTGIDMVEGTCAVAARKGYSIYILGSEPGIAARAAQNLQARHPGLVVAGTQHGFFSREGISEEQVAAAIAKAHPDVLFVAFGIPKQEKFIAQHFATMKVPVSMGVGGSFDVYSEKLKRAPIYIQRAGLEWVYRVWIEPWRWKRMGYVPRFMLLALRVWLFGERDRNSKRNAGTPQ